MIKAIIVDDEPRARETIRNIVQLYAQNVEIVDEAANISAARKAIEKHRPHLVFLDINMPGGDGFELLKVREQFDFKVIFITAFEEYAVKAFRFSALDFIVKPVDPDDLIQAIEKVEKEISKNDLNLRIEALLSNMENIKKEVRKIVLKTSESIHLINVPDIIRLEADGNYTVFYLTGPRRIIVSHTLKDYDELLAPYGFFRPHQSFLINLKCIERFEKKDGGYLVMNDASKVPVSVRKKDTLLSLLERI
jgi:two-component system, LytTR family, response regulator